MMGVTQGSVFREAPPPLHPPRADHHLPARPLHLPLLWPPHLALAAGAHCSRNRLFPRRLRPPLKHRRCSRRLQHRRGQRQYAPIQTHRRHLAALRACPGRDCSHHRENVMTTYKAVIRFDNASEYPTVYLAKAAPDGRMAGHSMTYSSRSCTGMLK